MHQNERSPGNHSLRWVACVGLILFALIQVFPIAVSSDSGNNQALSRDSAKKAALRIAEDQFHIPAEQVGSIVLTHLSDSDAVGYFSKNRLLDRYEKQWAANYPTDVYRADLQVAGKSSALILMLNLQTGKLVGWQDESGIPVDLKTSQTNSAQSMERALAYASFWGVRPADWEWTVPDALGMATFVSRKATLGEARLRLEVQVPPGFQLTSSAFPSWKGGSVTYRIDLPHSFTAYVADQKKLAGTLNAVGFVLPQLIMLVLSIVYAAARRKHTSFKRGIVLASIFLILYAAFTFNMIPGFRAQVLQEGRGADDPLLSGMIISNLIVLAGMALFTYFAAVAGDGLWKSMGRSLWPRWRESGFGDTVVVSMKRGYLLALILLGVQSVILLGLEKGIGMFQASDATQSTYNMTYPWLLLLLAWCAGISEEMQSRFFGIGLFRSWLVGGAKKLLGREPGTRSTTVLTWIAMLPPGLFWAFGHVGYAVYPAYSRLIELVLMGMLFGWFLLRFGLMAVIFAHVTLDSTLMGVQMVFDGLPGDLPAGLIGILMPAVVAYALGWIHGKGSERTLRTT
ncbi:MAG: family intrarane metalloprotease [Cohnella sp.]|nr:family intrarane metalloprotease [Cohnella sp.]